MKPIETLPDDAARAVDFVLTDIDDTLTENGYLGPKAYGSLWALHRAGIRVIPVTGRPAGWCDLIVREWPVDGVVGENGAFVYYREGRMVRTMTHPSVAGRDVRGKLDEIRDAVLAEVPGSRVARDQFARLFDLAIDFREDPPELTLEDARRIKSICERYGANAKISSIHVNTWFGSYDKVTTSSMFLKGHYGVSDEELKHRVLFCGDSPNDEPMFRLFPLSCAVANIEEFAGLLGHEPGFVSRGSHGTGFAEIIDTLLEKRGKVVGKSVDNRSETY